MRLLRHIVFLRALCAGLLTSLGLGVAAPALAVELPLASFAGLDEVPAEALEAALAAAADARTPEALAEHVAASLEEQLGTAPPVETLLAALYGSLFRALQDEVGSHAVVAQGSVPVVVAAPSAAVLAETHGTFAAGDAEVVPPRSPDLPAPLTRYPALQPLGP